MSHSRSPATEIEPSTEPDTAQASTAGRLVDELLRGGEAIDEGGFSLDPAAAAAKLDQFKYADRGPWLVPIVEGLLGLGAREIVIETRRRDLSIRALGTSMRDPERDFNALYSHALGHSTHANGRALARIAVGLDMILGDSPRITAQLRHDAGSTRTIAGYRWRAAPQISREPSPASTQVGDLELFVARPRLAGWIPQQTELTHLYGAVRFSPTRVMIDGGRASQVDRAWTDPVHSGEGPGYRFQAALEPWSEREAQIELWSNGIRVDRVPLSGGAFTGVIELDEPRRDLSQMRIVHDATVEQAIAAVGRARATLLAQLESTGSMLPAVWEPAHVAFARGQAGSPGQALPARGRQQPISATALSISRFSGMAALTGFTALMAGFTLFTSWLEVSSLLVVGALELLGASVVPWLFLCWPAVRRVWVRDHGARTHATITAIDELTGNSATPFARVEWSFIDGEGRTWAGSSKPRLSQAQRWRVGESITIFYDPADPELSLWEADVGPRRYAGRLATMLRASWPAAGAGASPRRGPSR
jgi:hypothetical protein